MQITGMREAPQRREGNEIGNRKKRDINFILFILIKCETKRKYRDTGVSLCIFLHTQTFKITFKSIKLKRGPCVYQTVKEAHSSKRVKNHAIKI